MNNLFLISIAAALLPALVLLIFIYRKDKVEREPVDLILKLLLMGVLSALLASVIESLGMGALDRMVTPDKPYYVALLAFLVVGIAEEGSKYLFLKWRSWKNPNFDFLFDGIVYAAAVSLGFAAFENIIYVLGYGLSVAPARAVFAVPGHLSFSVFMGFFYGRARLAANCGDRGASVRNQLAALFSAVFFHGLYDTCAMTQTDTAALAFLGFVVIMFIWVFVLIHKGSKYDRPIR